MQENRSQLNHPVDADYGQRKRELDIGAKLHQGISARLCEDKNRLRQRLSQEQMTAYETALQDIKKVRTIDEAQAVLQTLFDKIYSDTQNMPTAGNDEKISYYK